MRVSHLAPRCLQWARVSGVGRGPVPWTGHCLHDFASLSREATKITLPGTRRTIAFQGSVPLRRRSHPCYPIPNLKAMLTVGTMFPCVEQMSARTQVLRDGAKGRQEVLGLS